MVGNGTYGQVYKVSVGALFVPRAWKLLGDRGAAGRWRLPAGRPRGRRAPPAPKTSFPGGAIRKAAALAGSAALEWEDIFPKTALTLLFFPNLAL